jgi:spore germination protein
MYLAYKTGVEHSMKTNMTLQKVRLQSFVIILLATLLVTSNGLTIYHLQQIKQTQVKSLYQAEAMYQRVLGELCSSVQIIHHQLAQLLVTSSKEQMLYGLSNLWREVYAAIQSLGTLPIAMHQLEQTDLLLHDMAEYSYHLMKKNMLPQHALSATDWTHLEDFYHRTEVVQQELEQLETAVLSNNFFLTSISLDDESNPLHTAFQNIENHVRAFPTIEFEEGVRKIAPESRPISGTYISETDALNNANMFLQTLAAMQPNIASVQHTQGDIAFIIDNATIPVYGVQFGEHYYVEVSQIGGHVLQYYYTRELSQAVLTLDDAKIQAYNILHTLHLPNMVCVEQKADNNTASFVFVPLQENVYLYPDMIKMQLALDDGTLLNFDQTHYQTNHYNRTLQHPSLTEQEIRESRNPNFQTESIHLALISDAYSSSEQLTYELRGTIAGESFAIFIDAHTGEELRIIHL